ncbi:Type II secretion system protein F [Rosistilla carotiformis]|uniref:Type II secretion system protein F n=1 Tax=Rosistilla carotiformis TaxID=2528017 RepID=A0A518JQM9_9BACT|nr:type II secretion system F family protein [Rosistilla carotiformis]QDV67839.1 Type II secretion system protein F [Rosistilla carotiformis]
MKFPFNQQNFPTAYRLGRALARGVRSAGRLEITGHLPHQRWRLSSRIANEPLAAKQRSLLRILAVAHREGLPTAQWVANLADEHHGRYRRRLLRLARRLQSGSSLVEALEQTPDALSDEMVLAIRFGHQSGTLRATFDQLLATPVDDVGEASPTARYSMFYLVGMMLLYFLVLSFLALRILPTLMHIAEEFEWNPSTAIRTLMAVSRFLEGTFLLWVLLGFAILRLVTSGMMRRFYRRVWASRLLRPVVRLRSAELLRLLSPAVAAGRPLGSALSTLARHHYDRNVRAKLLFARNEVEQGSDPWSALSVAGLLQRDESQALAGSTSNGTRAWLMHRLADRHQRQFGGRVALLLSLLQPAIVLALAGIVAWIGFAFFGFLSGIILMLA